MKIVPFKSVGSLIFGSSVDEVEAVLGKFEYFIDRPGGLKMATCDDIIVFFDKNGLTEIEIFDKSGIELEIEEISLFNNSNFFEELVSKYGKPMHDVGSVIFPLIGLSTNDPKLPLGDEGRSFAISGLR